MFQANEHSFVIESCYHYKCVLELCQSNPLCDVCDMYDVVLDSVVQHHLNADRKQLHFEYQTTSTEK